AKPPAVSFLRHTNTRTRIDARRYLHLHLLALRRRSVTMAERTRFASTARAFAIGTRLRKLQPSARTHHLPRALAGRTRYDRAARIARSLTTRTLLRAVYRYVGRKPRKSLVKTQRKRDLDVAAAFRNGTRRFRLSTRSAAEKARKTTAIAARTAAASARKIEPREIKTACPTSRLTACTCGRSERRIRIEIVRIIAEAVKALSFFRVRQDIVRFLYVLELVLGRLVVRIYVRVIFARQTPIRLLYLVGASALFNT